MAKPLRSFAPGRSVLVSQFVAGLIPALKAKVASTDGKFEEILVKARFEEAKLCDLGQSASNSMAQKPVEQSNQSTVAQRQSRTVKCSKCGSTNYIAKHRRWQGRAEPGEARGGARTS